MLRVQKLKPTRDRDDKILILLVLASNFIAPPICCDIRSGLELNALSILRTAAWNTAVKLNRANERLSKRNRWSHARGMADYFRIARTAEIILVFLSTIKFNAYYTGTGRVSDARKRCPGFTTREAPRALRIIYFYIRFKRRYKVLWAADGAYISSTIIAIRVGRRRGSLPKKNQPDHY